jgi:hypothetical protein
MGNWGSIVTAIASIGLVAYILPETMVLRYEFTKWGVLGAIGVGYSWNPDEHHYTGHLRPWVAPGAVDHQTIIHRACNECYRRTGCGNGISILSYTGSCWWYLWFPMPVQVAGVAIAAAGMMKAICSHATGH